jgi:glycosyltransferase involved in cell wall biosynthesis
MNNNKHDVIGLITLFGRKPGDIFLTNLLDILSANVRSLHVVCPFPLIKSDKEKIIYHYAKIKSGTGTLSKMLDYITLQIESFFVIIKNVKIKHWLFYEGETLLLPMIAVKMLRKYSTLILSSSLENEAKLGNKLLYIPLLVSKWICCRLANKIIVYSPRLVDVWGLRKFSNKIKIAPKHFIDFTLFNLKRNISQREDKIGFIGRFSNEKGILNFINATYLVSNKMADLNFVLIGDGPLMAKIKELIKDYNLKDKVKLCGWISHETLSDYLNQFKLIVLPSYTEGLPNIMLESMACGTPVLCTPVGAIPDIIEDEQTGFILENNSPECIAQNILRALNHPGLAQISENGRLLMQKEFTFERAKEKCQVIFNNS